MERTLLYSPLPRFSTACRTVLWNFAREGLSMHDIQTTTKHGTHDRRELTQGTDRARKEQDVAASNATSKHQISKERLPPLASSAISASASQGDAIIESISASLLTRRSLPLRPICMHAIRLWIHHPSSVGSSRCSWHAQDGMIRSQLIEDFALTPHSPLPTTQCPPPATQFHHPPSTTHHPVPITQCLMPSA